MPVASLPRVDTLLAETGYTAYSTRGGAGRDSSFSGHDGANLMAL